MGRGSTDKENAGDKPTGERKMASVWKKRETGTLALDNVEGTAEANGGMD